jgi:CRP-like cAMP-binding protein
MLKDQKPLEFAAQSIRDHHNDRVLLWHGICEARQTGEGSPGGRVTDGVAPALVLPPASPVTGASSAAAGSPGAGVPSLDTPEKPGDEDKPAVSSTGEGTAPHGGDEEEDDDEEEGASGPGDDDDEMVGEIPKFVIHPTKKEKIYWDLYVSVCIFYSVLTVPFMIGFDIVITNTNTFLYWFEFFVDMSFIIDFTLCFFTAYVASDGGLETRLPNIRHRYMMSGFTVDFASTVPIDRMAARLGDGGRNPLLRSTKMLRILRLAKLVKLVRLLKLGKSKPKDDDVNMFINPSVIALLRMLLQLLFIAHLLGCLWHWLVVLQDGCEEDDSINDDDPTNDESSTECDKTVNFRNVNWMTTGGLEGLDIPRQYMVSVYWAFTTMTTVGYGDINVANDLERGFAIFAMLIGASVFGYVIGNVTVMMENFDQQAALHREKMDRVKEYLRDRKFPMATMKRIKKQFKYFYRKLSVFDSQEIVSAMPTGVTNDLLFKQYAPIIQRVPMLRDANKLFVALIAPSLKPFYAEQGEFIFFEGELSTHMYFIFNGKVQLLLIADGTPGVDDHVPAASGTAPDASADAPEAELVVFGELENGSTIGETALMLHQPQLFSAVAATFCDMYSISKEELMATFDFFPDMQDLLMASAKETEAAVYRRHPGFEDDDNSLTEGTPMDDIGCAPAEGCGGPIDVASAASGGGVAGDGVEVKSEGGASTAVQKLDAVPPSPDANAPGSTASTLPSLGTGAPAAADTVASGGLGEVTPPSESAMDLLSDAMAASADIVGTNTGDRTAHDRMKNVANLAPGPTNASSNKIHPGGEETPGATGSEQVAKYQSEGVNLKPEVLWRRHKLFHPEHALKTYWDVLVCIFIIYSVITVTYRIGFRIGGDSATRQSREARELSPASKGFDYLVDVTFGFDMIATFNTGYFNEQILVYDRKRIRTNYLYGWFSLDFFSTVPIDVMLGGFAGSNPAFRMGKLLRALRLVRLVKIARILKMSDFFEEYEDALAINPGVLRLLKLFVLMGFAAHICACIFYYTATSADFALAHYDDDRWHAGDDDDVDDEADEPNSWSWGPLLDDVWNDNDVHPGTGQSWIDSYCNGVDDDSHSLNSNYNRTVECLWQRKKQTQYITAMYWAFTTMTTVGYGDIGPNLFERGSVSVTILSQVVGTTLFAYVIGCLVAIVLNLDPGERNRKMQVNYLNDFIRDLQLERTLRRQLKRHYNYRLKFKSVFQEDTILQDLPPHVRNPALLFLHRSTLPYLPFFCQLESKFLGALAVIIPKLRPSCYGEGDIVNGPDINAREWVFMLSGCVTVSPAMPTLAGDAARDSAAGTSGARLPRELSAADASAVERFKPGSYFGEATIFMPDNVPFTLLVEAKVIVPFTNVLMLTRAEYAQTLKFFYPPLADEMCVGCFVRSGFLNECHDRRSLSCHVVLRCPYRDKVIMNPALVTKWLTFPAMYAAEVFQLEDEDDEHHHDHHGGAPSGGGGGGGGKKKKGKKKRGKF